MDFLKTTNYLRAEDLDFGKDDAESDERLKDWFLETSEFKNVMQLEYSLILGQKGSCKSAILRMLHERAGKDMIIIDLSPQQYQWQNLRGSMEAGIPSPHAESLVWTASLTISLMNYIVQYAGYLDDPLQIIPQFRQFLVDLKLLRGKESISEY